MKQLAKLGLGVALMAPWVAEKEPAEGSLVMRPTPRSKVTRQWVVIRQGHRELRKPEQTFIGPLPNGGRPSRQTIRRWMALRAGQRGLQEASVDCWEMPSLGDIEESPKTGEFATPKAPSQPVPQSSGRNNAADWNLSVSMRIFHGSAYH